MYDLRLGQFGGLVRPSALRLWLLIELAPRDKNERIGRYETKRLVAFFKVIGHLVTSDVTKGHFDPPNFFGYNLLYNKDNDMGVAPSCFSRRDASNDVLLDLERSF